MEGSKAYVLGGIVDRVKQHHLHPHASFLAAKQDGVEARRLPIDRYIQLVCFVSNDYCFWYLKKDKYLQILKKFVLGQHGLILVLILLGPFNCWYENNSVSLDCPLSSYVSLSYNNRFSKVPNEKICIKSVFYVNDHDRFFTDGNQVQKVWHCWLLHQFSTVRMNLVVIGKLLLGSKFIFLGEKYVFLWFRKKILSELKDLKTERVVGWKELFFKR